MRGGEPERRAQPPAEAIRRNSCRSRNLPSTSWAIAAGWRRVGGVEDETALAEVVIFPDVYERDGAHLAEFGVLCVTGTVEDQMGACSLHAEVIW